MAFKPKHPLAPAAGYLSLARINLFDRIGWGPHPCHWCGMQLEWRVKGPPGGQVGDLIADHLDANPLDDSPMNLVPSCIGCNGNRSVALREGELVVDCGNGSLTRAVERSCEQCGTTFLAKPAELKRPNRGRFCSLSCARKAPRVRSR